MTTLMTVFVGFATVAVAKPTVDRVSNAFGPQWVEIVPRGGLANLLGSNLDSVFAVSVNGVKARFKVTSANHLNLVVPAEVAIGSAVVLVEDATGTASVSVWVDQFNPAIGGDQSQPCCAAYAQHADSSLVNAQKPARKGEAVTIFVTGVGNDPSPALIVDVGQQPVRVLRVTPWSFVADAAGPLFGLYAVTFEVPAMWSGPDVSVSAGGVMSDRLALHLESASLKTAEIVVDFLALVGVKNMSGFLMGGDVNRPPPDRISPLKPRLYRAGQWTYMWAGNGASWPRLYDLFRGLGSRVELILGAMWNNGQYDLPPFPFDDWARWEAFVRKMARDNRNNDLLWDVWNEPDLFFGKQSWLGRPLGLGSKEQFFETYLRAYRILREELGSSALIGGPSLSVGAMSWSEARAFITGLLDFCKQHGCEVNFISWHALTDLTNDVPALAERLLDIRRSFLENPSYAAVKIREIHINEYVGRTAIYDPGTILGYLYYLEQGGADAAAKSCWPDSLETRPDDPAANQCQNGTMDGILTRDTFQPRAAWWAYAYYAAGTSARVAAVTSDRRVVPIANSASDGTGTLGQVLIGYFNYVSQAPAVPISVTLKGLANLTAATLLVERIPRTGEAALLAPIVMGQIDVTIAGGSARAELPELPPGEAYRILVIPK